MTDPLTGAPTGPLSPSPSGSSSSSPSGSEAEIDDRVDEVEEAPTQELRSDPAPEPDPIPGPAAGTSRRRLRLGTVVLGLVLAVVAATVWIDRVLERHVSVGGVATAVMIGAGALLLGGALLRQAPRT